MKELIDKLTTLGFSSQEARIYLSLLKGGQMTGYQIAKDLGVNRSSVYNVLQALFKKGAVDLIPGDNREYLARDPGEFIAELKRNYQDTADQAISDLQSFKGRADSELFFNIRGKDRMLAKIREIISLSRREILINSDIPVAEFDPELSEACERGVRVTMFSFFPQDVGDRPIRFFKAGRNPEPGHPRCEGNSRIMLAADMRHCILGGFSRGEFTATYSENPLLTSVIAEHIHIDVYLLGLRKEYGIENIPGGLLLQSMLEEGSEV